MKILELLSELRRNPELNVVKQGHAAAVEFLNKLPAGELENYGVSMTEIPKLGINPQSRYNTPLGVYFYPASYYLDIKQDGKPLLFQDSAPYIQILKLSGNYIRLDQYSDADYAEDIEKLMSSADSIGSMIGKSGDEVQRIISTYDKESVDSAAVKSAAGQFWYVVWRLTGASDRSKRASSAPRASVVWNKLFRLIGIDGIIDPGTGVVHENEPYQGVALNPTSVRVVQTFDNKQPDDSKASSKSPFAWMLTTQTKSPDEYVMYILNKMLGLYPDDFEGSEGIIRQVAIRVANNLDKVPKLYGGLNKVYFSRLIRLAEIAKMPKLVEKFTVEYYTHQFENNKQDIDSMQEIAQMPDVAATKKADVINAFLKKFDAMKTDLTPYAGNKAAADILNTIKKFQDLADRLEKESSAAPVSQ